MPRLEKIVRLIIRLLFFSTLALLFSGLLLYLPPIQRLVLKQTQNKLSEILNARVGMGSVRFNFAGQIVLSDAYLIKKHPDTLFFSNKIAVRVDPVKLLSKTLYLDYIHLSGLKTDLLFYEDSSNLDFLFRKFTQSSSGKRTEQEKKGGGLEIEFHNLYLNDIQLHLYIENELDLHLALSRLSLRNRNINLKNLEFDLKQLTISGLKGELVIPDDSAAEFLHFADTIHTIKSENEVRITLDALNVSGVDFSVAINNPGIRVNHKLDKLKLQEFDFDWPASTITAGDLFLSGSSTQVHLTGKPESIPPEITRSGAPSWLMVFPLEIALDHLSIKNHRFQLQSNPGSYRADQLDPGNFLLQKVNIECRNIGLGKNSLKADLKNISLFVNEDFGISDTKARLDFGNGKWNILGFRLNTYRSSLAMDITLDDPFQKLSRTGYPALVADSFWGECMISSADLVYLTGSDFISDKGISRIRASWILSGSMENLNIKNLSCSAGDNLRIQVKGNIAGLDSMEGMRFRTVLEEVLISKDFLTDMIPDGQKYSAYMPPFFCLKGEMKGGLDSLSGMIYFSSNYGSGLVKGDLIRNEKTFSLSGDLDMRAIDLGQVLTDQRFGKTNFYAGYFFRQDGPEQTKMDIRAGIDSLVLNGNLFTGIRIELNQENGLSFATISSNQKESDCTIKMNHCLSDSIHKINMEGYIDYFDLHYAGLITDSASVSGNFTLMANLSGRHQEIQGNLREFIFYEKEIYKLQQVDLDFLNTSDTTGLKLKAGPASVLLSSSIPVRQLYSSLTSFYKRHLSPISIDTISEQKIGKIFVELHGSEFGYLLAKIIPGMDYINYPELSFLLDEIQDTSCLELFIPGIGFSGFFSDSIRMSMISGRDNISYRFQFPNNRFSEYEMNNIDLTGKVENRVLFNNLIKTDSLGRHQLDLFLSLSRNKEGIFILQFPRKENILNYETWSIPEISRLEFTGNQTPAGTLQMVKNEQYISYYNNDSKQILEIQNFNLENFSGLISGNNSHVVLEGTIQASLDLTPTPFFPVRSINGSIKGLAISNFLLGDVQFHLNGEEKNTVGTEIGITYGNNNLSFNGVYQFQNGPGLLDYDLLLRLDDLEKYGSFDNDEIQKLNGRIRGNINLTGTTEAPVISGEVNFLDATFYQRYLNRVFVLKKEKIKIDNNGIYFNQFRVADEAENSILTDGYLRTDFINFFNYDLVVKAEHFTLFDIPEKNDPGFYGNLMASADVHLKGNYLNPDVYLNMVVLNGTDLTYVLAPEEIDLVSYEGIVEFRDVSDPDTLKTEIVRPNLYDSITSRFSGTRLDARVEIQPLVKFCLNIDPLSGDQVNVRGSGVLNLKTDPSGSQSLTGTYEMLDGEYNVSFYGLVKKNFLIEEGSTISWAGDPGKGNINLTASSIIRTASSGLVANEIYGLPEEEKNQYNKPLPYEVKIMISNRLEEPEINYLIDLPQDDKNAFPLVATKLIRLKEPGNESKLTQQVFGLLTIGSFIPERGGDSGSYGSALATTAAANSLNGMLTNEINKLSGQYLKIVDLNVGLQTYADVTGGNSATRTSMDINLSKKLYNDRLTLEAQSSFDIQGNNNNSATAGYSMVHNDFAIIYDLNKQRDLKLKAFDRSSYDLIYKEIRVSGIALIFIKEYDPSGSRKNDR